jgi:hypothetical protein
VTEGCSVLVGLPSRSSSGYIAAHAPIGRPYGKALRGERLAALLLNRRASAAGGSLSEARVKRGQRVVHGDKDLVEKLGRNDRCPCGSGRRFQEMLYEVQPI